MAQSSDLALWSNSTAVLLAELLNTQESLLARLEDANLMLSPEKLRLINNHLSKSERYVTLLHSLHDEMMSLSQRYRRIASRAESLSRSFMTGAQLETR